MVRRAEWWASRDLTHRPICDLGGSSASVAFGGNLRLTSTMAAVLVVAEQVGAGEIRLHHDDACADERRVDHGALSMPLICCVRNVIAGHPTPAVRVIDGAAWRR
jgi:hypothetical protein